MRRSAWPTLIVCISTLVTRTPAVLSDDAVAAFTSGFWRRLPALPESKEQFGLEACAGRIYAIGGVCDGSETASAFVYDIDQHQWLPMAPLPREAQSLCLCAVNGRLFSFGGYDSRLGVKYEDVWLYDPNQDVWLPRCPMPVPREDAGSAVINGQVWIIGGLTNPGHNLVSQIDVYDPNLDTWVLSTTIRPKEEDWSGRALGDFACAIGPFLYCLGGTETMNYYSWWLQPASWGFLTDGVTLEYIEIPDPRCYAEVEVVGGLLCIVGGCRKSLTDYADTMLIYDPSSYGWKDPVLLPYAARGQGACSWNGILYLAGGYSGRTRQDFYQWAEHTGHDDEEALPDDVSPADSNTDLDPPDPELPRGRPRPTPPAP